jgi:hypothetical protein
MDPFVAGKVASFLKFLSVVDRAFTDEILPRVGYAVF